LNQAYLFYGMIAAMWCFAEFSFRFSATSEMAGAWLNISYVCCSLAVAQSLHFSVIYAEENFGKKYQKTKLISYVILLCMAVISPFLPVWFFYIWSYFLVSVSIIIYIFCYLKGKGALKKQIFILCFGMSFPLVIGIFSEMITVGSVFSMIIFAYAMVRYDLFAINPMKAAGHIISSMSEALFLVGVDNRIKYVNKAGLVLLDAVGTDITGKSIDMFFKDESMLVSCSVQEIPVIFSRSTFFDPFNNPIAWILVAKDLRVRKKVEEERHKARKQVYLNSKLASIGILAEGVAHEVNNPLFILKGYVDLIKGYVTGKDRISKENLYNFFIRIDNSTDRITRIINGLRVYARASSDVVASIDLHSIIEETILFVGHIFKNDRIDIVCDLQAQNSKVIGNRDNIRQVIVNVLSNSRDALINTDDSEKKREISIVTVNINDKIYLDFMDNGPGISRDVLDNIFNPFYTTKEPDQGSGLGLSIAQSIISSMDGSISVDSEPSYGTVIKIGIPVEGTAG
jgi:signal transduction histidine kinase